MTPVVASLVAGALVLGGTVARGKKPGIDNAIGIAGIALSLALLDQMNEKLARGFGTLIVVAIAVVHFPAIVKATGLGELR